VDPNQPGKSSSTKKWLIGCGIGCGVVIVIAALLITGGVLYVRNLVKGFEDSEALLETLTEKYGRITEFTPYPEGRIPAVRIERFLEAREATREQRDEIERSIALLDEDQEIDMESGGNIFQKIKLGFGLIPQIAGYFKARNQALLDAGMGMGEYYYLYSIIYFAWLDKPLLDGPPISFGTRDEEIRIEDWDDEEAREVQRDLSRRRIHRMLLPMLQNQYDRLAEGSPAQFSQDWREALEAELEAMEEDRYRLPWEDGLPEVTTASLKPYRTRLESSYSRLMNAIEISMEQR